MQIVGWNCSATFTMAYNIAFLPLSSAGGGSKDANDLRDMEMEKRLRAGEEGCEPWRELGGFEKYTKVCLLLVYCHPH